MKEKLSRFFKKCFEVARSISEGMRFELGFMAGCVFCFIVLIFAILPPECASQAAADRDKEFKGILIQKLQEELAKNREGQK